MRIPARIIEHPVEAAIAGILLLVLLLGSADRRAAEAQAAQVAPAQETVGHM
ncbi:MAG TPA: hypothetical protein VGM26_10925 [Rhizomicrobium sp.]